MIHFSIFFTLLLPAPATGVDAASLSPHEVLPREGSIVGVSGWLTVLGVDGGAASALEPCSIPSSAAVGDGKEAAGWTGAVWRSGTRQDTFTEE